MRRPVGGENYSRLDWWPVLRRVSEPAHNEAASKLSKLDVGVAPCQAQVGVRCTKLSMPNLGSCDIVVPSDCWLFIDPLGRDEDEPSYDFFDVASGPKLTSAAGTSV